VSDRAGYIALTKGLYGTGAMVHSMGTMRRKKESDVGLEVWAVGVFKADKKFKATEGSDPAHYWKFAEYGTVKQQATPFLGPAMDEKYVQVVNTIANTLRVGISAATKKLKHVPPK
jgi:HK97 gp10 family phage protein